MTLEERVAILESKVGHLEHSLCVANMYQEPFVYLRMSGYYAGNLRWLLREARSGRCKSVEGERAGCGLDTGDWLGELLYEVEQQIKDTEMVPTYNVGEPPEPIEGWGEAANMVRVLKGR